MTSDLCSMLADMFFAGGFVREIQPVFKAKVPVVKFLHCNTGIECDVSIENKDGIIKSEFLRIFSSIDSRFRKLCFLVCVSLLTVAQIFVSHLSGGLLMHASSDQEGVAKFIL